MSQKAYKPGFLCTLFFTYSTGALAWAGVFLACADIRSHAFFKPIPIPSEHIPPSCVEDIMKDCDGDGFTGEDDVDDDNDGLIEIRGREGLEEIRHDLGGTSRMSSADSIPKTTGISEATVSRCESIATGMRLCGYELVEDVDLEDEPFETIPSGDFSAPPFTGILDGGGHKIKRLRIMPSDSPIMKRRGLFATVGPTGVVSNIEIEDVDFPTYIGVSGLRFYSGGIASRNEGIIENCSVVDTDPDIDITAASLSSNTIGGIAAQHRGGVIRSSHTKLSIQGGVLGDTIGGLVGFAAPASGVSEVVIISSYSESDIFGGDEPIIGSGGDSLGGLVGTHDDGSAILVSYATGNIQGENGNDRVGGLVGGSFGGFTRSSYALGDVNGGSGNDSIGGLFGGMTNNTVSDSYATGNVDGGMGDDSVGRLIGSSSYPDTQVVTESYGFGEIIVDMVDMDTEFDAGGSIGASVSPWPGGITGMGEMAANMLSGSSMMTMLYAGTQWSANVWDFGSSSQLPALKYVDSYDSASMSYICDSLSRKAFSPSIDVICGTTLLPGPNRSR